MSEFQTPRQVWEALAAAAPGPARAEILAAGNNRQMILNSGSFVIFSTGTVNGTADTFKDRLAPISIIQTQRLRSLHDGPVVFDGKGTFGGLSERSIRTEKLTTLVSLDLAAMEGLTLDEFLSGPFKEKLEAVIAKRDDLRVDEQGRVIITTDLSDVALVTAAREFMEESAEMMAMSDIAGKLHIDHHALHYIFRRAALSPVPLQNVRDDNYVLNIWNGNMAKPAFAVTPFGHLASIDTDSFDRIAQAGCAEMREGRALLADPGTTQHLRGREILGAESVPLFEALGQWGKPDAAGSGRDLSHDYRYPHEWIGLWRLAQVTLGLASENYDPAQKQAAMIALIKEVQNAVLDKAAAQGTPPYNVDIFGALVQMNGGSVRDIHDPAQFDEDFGLPRDTFAKMHIAAERVMTDRGYKPTKYLVSYLETPRAPDSRLERQP